ncbi:Uncharacterised protein [Klebsiella grimontii]|nr:Uncharacterised protein [Klebsiella grimontii]
MTDNQARRQQLANFYLRSGHELDEQLYRRFPRTLKSWATVVSGGWK